jgi:hypothetical protein
MTEYLFGFILGMIAMGLLEWVHRHNKRIKQIVAQEKDYELLQQHVDKAVNCIERIIYRGKP